MKKPTTLKSVLVVLFFIQSFIVFSQKNFTARFDKSLKGDMLLIGNNILNRDNNKNNERPNNAFNATNQNNNDLNMQYIDVDSDNTTFSSSSANLVIPTASRECYKVVYAGLYWAGIYSKGSVDNSTVTRANLGSIKLKLPGQTTYNNVTGSLIYDYYPATSNGDQMPYAYYYDATALIQALANPEGTYTAANIISARGTINGGFSAGWNLFIVYEDPKSSAKYITSFDGFRWIQANSAAVTYDITGFKTIPNGAVKAKLAFAALEGDVNLTGDQYAINNIPLSTAERPVNNFFNSTINDTSGPYTNRNPASGNTLGFEAGILNVPNPATTAYPGGSVIKNGDTSAQLRLTTSGDGYGLFFNAFNVEIIEPKIVLTKIVKNAAGVNIGGQDVTLGQQLNYEIGFKNTGNDNATSFTIRDQLPINIIFNYPADIVSLPAGVTVQSYNATTRNIVFAVNNNIVKVGDPEKIISFKVQVVPDCHMLSEACSNSIDNSAYATYKGTQNTDFTISDDPSVNTNTGCILVPKATNFLVGVDGCKFIENVTLCGDSINLVAANGYTNYTWYSDEARTNQIATGQTLNVKNPGTYYVYNLAAAPCRSIYQSFVVTRFGSTVENPVIPFADQVVTCSNDGKKLPNIFLCGTNASRQITTSISDATSIVWEKLNEASCTAVTNQNCANESTSCTWASVGSGPNYTASIAGQYRLTLNYAGGCFNRFYFNVYTNSLTPTETHEDIICGLSGKITINGVPAGYEYALSTDPNGAVGAYQTSNVFTITNPNSYTVHIRQIGVTTNPCDFKVPGILIRKRDLQISTLVTQPSCFGEKGTIKVGALNIDPQYYYTLYNGNTVVNAVGPVTESDYTFNNLTPGITYRVRVTNRPINATQNCDVSEYIYIQQPTSQIVATAALVEPLTPCSDGKIVISATGGNYAPYYYFINGSTTFQTSNEIIVTAPGKYDIRVVDSKNCETTTSITVASNAKPTYTITHTNSNCYNDNAQITVNVSNANGYSMSYSINNGGSYQTNPVFSNLQPGTYNVIVRYGISYIPQYQTQPQMKYCTDSAQQVIISGPTSAVTASGGVAELAGCTLSQQGGKLRITNAQGGTAPYQYSFDGGTTWQASNEKDVLPGTYILKIKDALGCEYTIPYNIILDPKPADPTITVEDPVFNCNGTATSKVTVTNGTSANYTYEYYLDNNANTPITNNVFTNVPSGSHTVSVKYNVTTAATFSNLLKEDFGQGQNTTSPGIAAAYCFHDLSIPSVCADKRTTLEDNQYEVTSAIIPNNGSWYPFRDHTSAGANPNGRFLAINIGSAAGPYGILYSKPIVDVIPNQPVKVDLFVANLLNTGVNGAAPIVRFELVDPSGKVVATQDTGKIAETPGDPNRAKWVSIPTFSLDPGNNTNLTFIIRSGSLEYDGNDLLIDDISVYQVPKSCIATKDFPIVIDSNKAFTASVTGFKDVKCNGGNDGEITISAQNFKLPYGFDYSLDNGATWINSTVSPVTATGLTSKTYNIQVRFDASATSCVVPLTQVVKAPMPVTITATVTKQPTCTTGATITAVATGGTPAYQYELRQSNGTTVVTAFQSSGVFTNVPSGTYTVVTRDANSCSSPASTVVTVTSSVPPTATLAASSDLCYDTVNQSTLVVSVTGGTGAITYSLDGQPAQTSNTFTNVGPGTHNIVVTDSNSCTSLINNIVIAPQLLGNATISKTLDCTSASPDATITVNITGGNSAFTYKVKKGSGAYGSSISVTGTSFVYSASAADTYTFEITDAKGCITTVNAIVNPISNPTVTATKVDAACNGASTGSVKLVGAGGSGGYTYLFYSASASPVPTTFSAQFNYTGLAAGNYSYQVMDSKGCKSAVGNITISQPTTLTATATATTFTCNTSNVKQAATVTIAVPTTGTAPYQYSFDGGTTFTSTRTLSVTDNGINQMISYVVKDAQGCTTPVQTITINRLNPPTNITFSSAAVTCTATTTTVTAVATNGVTPITYSITSPAASFASNTTGVFAGLAAGTYNFRATDANGCYFDKPYTITAVTPISVVANKDSEVLCKGGSTGKVTFTVSGNATAGAYTYTLTPTAGTITKSGNTLTLVNVAAGTYSLQVTDTATGCTNTASVTVNEPANALTLTAVATNISCNNGIAQITVTPNGGTPNYTYAFVTAGAAAPTVFANGNVLSVDTNSGANLNWDVYVKDANGCVTPRLVTIAKDNLPTVTATNNNQCAGTGSTFVITATGTGKAPLTYAIDGTSFQTSNVFNVPAGTYTVTIKDANNCTATTVTPLVIYPQLVAVGSVTKELDCTATPNATITVAVSGGKASYTYTVKKGSGATSAPSAPFTGTSFTYNVTAANADSYTFVVTDANGCSSTTTTIVNTISNPTVTETHSNPSCDGGNNGSVALTGAGGSGGYTYSKDGITYVSNATFTGLAAGTYTFYVKDSKNCATPITIVLTAPTQLAATVTEVPFSCNATNGKVAGSITVNVTSGTGTTPYQYSFNAGGFGNSNTLTLNDNGGIQPYTYSVRDGQGCTISGSGALVSLNPPTDLAFAAPAVTCTATTTTVTLTATNGVGTLQYETIAPSPVIIAKQTSNTFANLAPGTYMFKVTDSNGCYYTEAHTINPVTPISVVANKDSEVLCKGGSTGKVTFTVSGNATAGAYTYTLTPTAGTITKSGNTLTLVNVGAGTYSLQVTDTATGCTNTASVTVNEPANALTLTAVATNISCNNGIAQITVTPNGGTPNYTYAFVTAGAAAPTVFANGNVLSVDTNSGANLNWDVYVKDANGCVTPRLVTIAKDNLPTVTATNNNQCAGTGSTFVITATGTGKAPLTYAIDGTSFQTSNVFNVPAGTYTVTIKDANNCTATTVTPLVIYPQLVAVGSVTKELDCTATPNATITVAVSGGKASYTYTVKKGSGATSAPSAPFTGTSFTYNVTAANADSYTFVVTDANGCSSTTTTIVNTISNPTVTETHSNPSCDGGNNGSVALTGAGGSGGYTYSKDGITYVSNATFTGLAAGTYTFYVKDSKNCATPITIVLTAPTQLAATVTEVPFSCNATNGKVAGSITVNVTSGTGTTPYQYSFNAGGFGNSNTLTLNDNGGIQPYTYSVRDGQGCTISGSGALVSLNPPTDLAFAAPAVTCTATTTTVTLTATNGVGTLQYETIAPSPVIIAKQTSNTFANLAPGTYMFKVTDANGCYYTESFTVKPVTPITAVASKLSDVLCNGGNTGSIRLTVGGFASTYSYTVNGGTAITGVSSTTVALPNLVAGNYAIVVTDEATGCTAPVSMTISQPAVALSATYAAVNGNCSVSTSAVTVTATGGTPVYRYSFVQDGAAVGTYTNSNKANLDPAVNLNWDVYIIDANNCTFKLDITITKDPVPTVTASAAGQCFGVGSYTITATPGTGLVAPLSYSIDNGASYQAGNTFVITTPGSYTVKIKDGNGCTANSNVVIVDNILGLTAALDKNITCSAPTAAQVTLTANGGSAPYTYESKEAAGAYTAMASNVFNTMTPGSYTFRVTDAKGCKFETATPIIITAPVNPDITGVTQTAPISCSGDNTAAISITLDNTKGQAPFVYTVLNTTTGVNYGTQTSGLAAGNYTITVTDAKGCTDTFPIVITQPAPIVIDYDKEDLLCVGGGVSKGKIIINSVTGGTQNYNYYVTGINNYNQQILNVPGTSAIFEVVDFGLYQIRVVDINGCSETVSNVTIAAPPNYLDINIATTANCTTGGTAVVTIGSAFPSTGPFHFNVYTGPGQIWTADGVGGWQGEMPANSKSTTFTNLTPGVTYTFIVYDQITKCYYYQTATTPIPTLSTLSISNEIENNITCTNAADGKISFTITSTYATTVNVTYQVYEALTNLPIAGISGTANITAGTPLVVSGLGPLTVGSYYVLIKETSGANTGCGIVSSNFNIKESPVELSLTASVSKNANCNPNSGVITAIAKDGTAPYTYQLLLASAPAPTATTAGWASINTFNRDAGSYIAYVKDAYGCIKPASVNLNKDADPTITAPVAICYVGNPFTIAISGTVDPAIVGDATYSVNGSAFQTSPNFTFNAPGTYTLVIKDGNGCTATTTYEVKPQLLLTAVLTKELDCTATPNATITLTATGGYNTAYTYEYSVNGGGYTTMASNVLSTSVLGNYTFRVTDAKLPLPSCQATATLTLDPIPATVFTTTQTNVSCFGSADGTITANVTSGVGPYEYQLDGGAFQTSNVFTGLIAGNSYVITVKDSKSCLYPSSAITITQPAALTATSVITVPLTCGTGNVPTKAIVTVTAADGTAPYLYSFDNGVTYTSTNTYEVFAGTTFDVLVKDAKGCTFTLTNGVNIPALNPPTNMDITGTPIWCAPAANTTSTVTISNVINGVGTLQYEILSPIVVAKQTSATFAGLTPDTYLFQVTDANGCTYQESYTISPVTNITVSGALVSNVVCNGETNGAVKFTVANYATGYTATLTSGTGTLTQTGNTVNVTGLVPGTYTVRVTDATTGCFADASVVVTQPSPVVLSLVSNTNANCNFGARVTVSAAGGTPGYKYAFVVSGATPAPVDYDTVSSVVLDPATSTAWDAYVLDANNCRAVYSFTIGTDALPTIDTPAAPYCYMGGPVPIKITGTYVGTPMYSIGNSYQSSPDFVLNAPGTYTFSIRDGNGCVTPVLYTLHQQLLLKATLTQDYTCAGDASITLLATQGTLTYNTFEVSYNNGAYTPVTVQPYTTNIPGTYTFRVTDSQGCQATSVSVEVTPRTTPTATAIHNNVSCTGGSDGSIIVTAANGLAPYQYQLDGGAFQTSNIFTGLAAGAHNIVVKDAKECVTITLPVTISQPTALAATATVTTPLTCGTGNSTQAATITVTVDPTTGTAPYQYSFNGGASYGSVNTYTTTVSGPVTALVRDANLCVIGVPASVNVQPLDPPTNMDITGTPIWCLPAANTTSTVTISNVINGVGTLQYEILSPIVVAKQTSATFAGLAPDTYLFQVTDANGCTYQESYTISPVTNITVSGALVSNVVCNGETNGAVKFTVANYATGYTATLTSGTGTLTQTGNTVNVTGLVPGTYTVRVTDATTGCFADASVVVTQPTPVVLSLVSNTNANCNFGARVTVSAAGGTPGYKYAFVVSGATPAPVDYDTVSSVVLDPATSTAWDAYVLDANNCRAVYSFTIGTDALPTIDTPAAPYCYMGGPVPIKITGTYVGTPMYSIGNSYQSSPDFVLNAPGTYTFSIRDGNGCVTPVLYTLHQQLLLKATLTQDYTCAGDASITLLATQGTLTYNTFEVSYNNGAYTPVTVQPYTTNIPGTYTFRVTDSQGCQATSVSVEVTPRTTPTATAIHNNVSCTGGSDGSIIVTAANGLAPYQYQLDGGAFQTSNIFTGLAAGAHNIVVKDAKECVTITLPVTISQPTALAATATVTTPLTCGTGNSTQAATITVTVDPTTGTAPYQYSFNGGASYGSVNTYTTTVSGPVTALVRDANLCVIGVPASVNVQPIDPPTITNIARTPIWCLPAANTTSTVTLTVSHGVGALHYEITSPASAVSNVSGATSGQFNLLPAGTYSFKVTDANGCTDVATYTIDALINITTAGQLINDVVCNGESNGSVKFDVDNFGGTYTATLTPSTGTLTKVGKVVTLTNLSAGNYTVTVQDDITGCTAFASVTVGQPDVLSLTTTKNTHANCKSGAEVTVVAAGGTPDYKYAFVLNTATVTAADYSNSNNAVLDPALGLNWVAYVIDSKDCKTSIPITIVLDPLPNNITTNVATQQCPSSTGEYTFTVTVGNGIAPYEYSIGNGFQTSNTFTVNAPGNYTVTVRDANQCEVPVATPVTILPALKLDYTITALPGCIITNNGSITATASGGSGTANYRYTLDNGVTVTTTPAVFNNVTPGSHTISVKDVTTGCPPIQVIVNIAPSTPITGLHLDPIHVTCNGGSNGSITASIDETGVNDNPVYVYKLAGTTALGVAVSRPNQPNPTFDNLQAGDYTVTVTSGRGCQDSEDITITQFDPIVVNAPIVVQYGCAAGTNTSNFATVTVGTVTKGSGTYTNYEFFRDGVSVQSGPQTVYTETDYLGGSYSVKVTDDAGCSGTSIAMPVNKFIRLDAIDVAKVAITCISNEDITITVTSTGGTPALLNYNVKSTDNAYNQTKTNGNFTGLGVGNYIITVTNPATGCSIQKPHYVADPNTFDIKVVTVNSKICYGTADGSVDLTFVDNELNPTDNAGPFVYTITGPVSSSGTTTTAGPITISNLTAGEYTVVAKLVNSPECTVQKVFNIAQPDAPLAVTTTQANITCNPGNNDGEISAAAKGGWDNAYQFELVLNGAVLVPYSTVGNFPGLSAGVYTINVKDGANCIASTTATLVIPAPIVASATPSATMLSCFGDKSAVITVNPPTGGQGSNYMYTLNILSATPVIVSGPQTSPIFTDLGAGTYSITVSDGFNCTATTADIVIAEPTEVIPSLVLTSSQTCNTQSTLTLSATGGSAPYTYSRDAAFATTIGSFASSVTFQVPVGTYQYYVKDAKGCVATVSNEIKIDPLVPLTIGLDVTNAVIKCTGEATGVIVATANGGLGNYIYTLENSAGTVIRPAQDNGIFEDLVIGTYIVKVLSGDCPATSAPIEIKEPAAALQAIFTPTNVSCFGENNGKIVVTTTGGTGTVKYAISPDLNQFDFISTFDRLAPGTYTIIAQDANGCFVKGDVVITQPNPIVATELAGSVVPELCKDDNSAAFSIEIKGGTLPYSVSLDNEKGPYVQGAAAQTVFNFPNLAGGLHTVYIKDAEGCSTLFEERNIPLPVILDPKVEVTYDCVDNKQANMVVVTIDASNLDPSLVKYEIDGDASTNQVSNIFLNVAPGPHKITAIHDNGCFKFTDEFIIKGYNPLTLAVSPGKPEMNIISVTASGGAPGYEYSFDGQSFTSDNKFKIYETRNYVIIVRDQNGCTATITVPGIYVDVCIPNYFTPNGDGQDDQWGPGCTNIYNNLVFDIFDRYGRVVAKYHYGEKWDGRYNGAELPTGDYWYVLKLNDVNDDREFVGHFTLYR